MASLVFAAGGIFTSVLFVRALFIREIRSGLFTYAALCFAAAIGLWRVRRWGRNLGLIMTMGNLGLGVLTLLAVLMRPPGPVVGPIILIVISLAMSFWLSRPAFNLPYDV